MKVERSYPMLQFISGLYKVLSIIAAIAGIFIAFVGHGIQSFIGIISGAIGCVSLLAASEILKLFLNIEENTRRTANLLEKEEVKKEAISSHEITVDSNIQA